jgi:hypothetical protein
MLLQEVLKGAINPISVPANPPFFTPELLFILQGVENWLHLGLASFGVYLIWFAW